jgi:hypothetical protein
MSTFLLQRMTIKHEKHSRSNIAEKKEKHIIIALAIWHPNAIVSFGNRGSCPSAPLQDTGREVIKSRGCVAATTAQE